MKDKEPIIIIVMGRSKTSVRITMLDVLYIQDKLHYSSVDRKEKDMKKKQMLLYKQNLSLQDK